MIRALILCSLTTLLCSAEPIDVLMKTEWISDKSLTMDWILNHRRLVSDQKKYENLFGKMTIKFSKDSSETAIGGIVNWKKHKIIGQTSSQIAMITFDELLKKDVIVTIQIDDDENGYWIYDVPTDLKEHFIPKPQ